MKLTVEPGKYVLAVSGGVDSMVLLDLLSKQPGLELVVAHFEHGIRSDSDEDRQLVEEAAKKYGLQFMYERGHLGRDASEAEARSARYAFLERVKEQTASQAIITAHHQDDLLETAVINLIRGTGRKGLTALGDRPGVLRPLLRTPKADILRYAQANHISWREDSTNQNEAYLRNYVRRIILPRLGDSGKQELLAIIEKARTHNPLIDSILFDDLEKHESEAGLSRYWFIMLPHLVACESMAAWLRKNKIREFDSHTIERLVVAAKVALPGKLINVNAGYFLKVGKTSLQLVERTLS